MWCEKNFEQFNSNLCLDQTRLQRIESAYARFIYYCQSRQELKNALAELPFFQGSFSYKTVIRPIDEIEFDIDIIFPFTLKNFRLSRPSGKELLDWFSEQLSNDADYKKRIIKMPRCVRLDYAGDFHLDIVMSTKELSGHQPYAVPTRDLSGWVTNDPIGLKSWVNDRDAQSKRFDLHGMARFARSVRMMKRWRDQLAPAAAAAPSSILLLTMLGNHEPSTGNYIPPIPDRLCPEYSQDAAYIYDMSRLTLSCIRAAGNRVFMHPTISGDNLAANWNLADIRTFETLLENFIENLRQAIFAATELDSIYYYKRAFGESFPN